MLDVLRANKPQDLLQVAAGKVILATNLSTTAGGYQINLLEFCQSLGAGTSVLEGLSMATDVIDPLLDHNRYAKVVHGCTQY